jgi:hypothetical protein
MKLEINSPVSRQIAPMCAITNPSTINHTPSTSLRHRAIIRSRRRRRGFGGPLQISINTIQPQ